MKILIMLLISGSLISCTSARYQDEMDRIEFERELAEDIKEDRIHGDKLPTWTKRSYVSNGIMYVVGSAEYSDDYKPSVVKKAAIIDGETKLLSGAPSDVRILTQNTIASMGFTNTEFNQVQTKLQKVVGITGIRHNQEKVECRKIVRYAARSTAVNRACWVQVYVPLKNLYKAYERTIRLEFGSAKGDEFREKISQELNTIVNNPLR